MTENDDQKRHICRVFGVDARVVLYDEFHFIRMNKLMASSSHRRRYHKNPKRRAMKKA